MRENMTGEFAVSRGGSDGRGGIRELRTKNGWGTSHWPGCICCTWPDRLGQRLRYAADFLRDVEADLAVHPLPDGDRGVVREQVTAARESLDEAFHSLDDIYPWRGLPPDGPGRRAGDPDDVGETV